MKKTDLLMIIFDWCGGIISWALFFYFRKQIELPGIGIQEVMQDHRLFLGLAIIPIVWLMIWFLLGSYEDVLRKSRLRTAYMTISGVTLGSLGMLFTVIRDDLTLNATNYLISFSVVWVIHFSVFLFIRLIYLTTLKSMLSRGIFQFRGVLITDSEELDGGPSFTSIIKIISSSEYQKSLRDFSIDSIVVEISNPIILRDIIPVLIGMSRERSLILHESSYDLLTHDYMGFPSIHTPYVTIATSPISAWQRNVKRIFDVIVSVLALIFLSPLMLWLFIKVNKSSSGGAFYRQERIGKDRTPFEIIKFRSMYENAETDQPLLAQQDDERCTPVGRWMRRWRLDELPQFINVLKGNMSLVGPRPERSFYSDQLVKRNPRYALLWQVKPGITSWGQIKFGYASNIEEMTKRFRFDLLYLENMSLPLDFRILYYTLIVLIHGKGR